MHSRDFDVIKTREEWLEQYDKHDILQKEACPWLLDNGFEILTEGDDRRYEEVWEAGDDTPDFRLRCPTGEQVYVDWKSKTFRDVIGWINQRSYHSYQRTEYPVFVGFGLVDEDEGNLLYKLFCDLDRADTVDEGEQWDKNDVYDLQGQAYVSQYQFIDRFKNSKPLIYRDKDSVIDKPLNDLPNDPEKIVNWVMNLIVW